MAKNSNGRKKNDFVARDITYDRVCVSGRGDDFFAIKSQGKWKKGYPDFNDLMDYFFEEKDLSEIQKFSSEARSSLSNIVKLGGKKKSSKRKTLLKTPACQHRTKILKIKVTKVIL